MTSTKITTKQKKTSAKFYKILFIALIHQVEGMASATSDLLAFKDYEDFGDSPQISVNSPKKVTLNGKKSSDEINFFKIKNLNYFR